MISISNFANISFIDALKSFFKELNVPVNYIADEPASPSVILGDCYKPNNPAHELIGDVYLLGIINDAIFSNRQSLTDIESVRKIKADYDGVVVFGITLKTRAKGLMPTRGYLAEISRSFNRAFQFLPVIVVFKYEQYISFAHSERSSYKQPWRDGEKTGKVTLLKDISTIHPHAAHIRILQGLMIDRVKVNSFKKLYTYWQSVFTVQALNDHFYSDLQQWFYYASTHIKLPIRPDYIPEKENTKNFLVRLLARTMFCWFVKEKGLVRPELLELKDWEGNYYPLTHDTNEKDFLKSNSYYRGILQNIFFNALNKKEKKSIKDFKWVKYIHKEFDIEWLIKIPYLNGGIFDKLEEDNAKESIEDTVLQIPNYLFYGIKEKIKSVKKDSKPSLFEEFEEGVEHKGLNGIFKSYKFTLEENTPYEEDIALDPELLGLVFENLLAELDPNLEESTLKSIRKLTGSYYTPRKVIREMVNESLFLYLRNSIHKKQLSALKNLIYNERLDVVDEEFCESIVGAIDRFRMLDPACGSGAFPMGMLHRLVDILKFVDPDNSRWIKLKLSAVDSNYRPEFQKILRSHVDDYSRKLGIIRDSIYGIDIQPLAVQITKLRFFISLLIDQNVKYGITPMPNIETKIICADSLKNINPDMFSSPAIIKLESARLKYYQPDLSIEERLHVTEEIVDVLDLAFPSFSFQVTGKRIKGQNKELIRHWFTHATIAAPFFNMDFFYPELKGIGFDCVIGNPPYGGVKISDEVRNSLGIESKDPYGAFIARFLTSGNKETPLKHGGVLTYIVSDTFMTIRSHLPLRKQMMNNYIHKMIRVHQDTFGATVNTAIIICERNVFPLDENNRPVATFNENHICQMVDMTNVSIHNDYDRFNKLLRETEGVGFSVNQVIPDNISTESYAIYYYQQSLIKINRCLPFFVADPKLYLIMNEGNDEGNKPEIEFRILASKRVQVRVISINGKKIDLVRFGEIANIKQGLATGDNHSYFFQKPEARGNYSDINDFIDFVLNENDLNQIRGNNDLRLEVIGKGISKNNSKSERYFGGRYIVPYDKGGESDADGGWMPNYFVQTNYYIDWSEWAVKRMKTYTIAQRIRENNENKAIKPSYETTMCAIIRSPDSYFTKAIDCSRVGAYSPTYRLATDTIFDSGCNDIYISIFTREHNLGILSSKLWRYQFITFINHTVNSQTDDNDELIYSIVDSNEQIRDQVKKIIKKQKVNPRYDYASNEQIEIDRLVYEAYGLNADDIMEVENWYARRYPKLSNAQKENLRNLGKSDDYLVLYGLKNE